MRHVYIVETHYDPSGTGTMFTIVRPSIPGHQFTYTGRTYKYTWARLLRLVTALTNGGFTTRFLKGVHLSSRGDK